MSLLTVTLLAAKAGHEEPVVNPYVVGGGALAILLVLLVGLLMFGSGREHT